MEVMRWMFVLLFCSLFMQEPEKRQKETFLRVAWSAPSTLDPALGRTREDARVLSALFEGLVTFGPDHVTPVPGVAKRWEVSEDRLTWTFHLGESKWSGGEPVTAGDFVYGWRRLLDPKSDAPFGNVLRIFKNVPGYLDAREARWVLSDLESALFAGEKIGERQGDLEFLVEVARLDQVPLLLKLSKKCTGEARTLLEKAAAEAQERATLKLGDLGFRAVDEKTLQLTLENVTPWLLDTLGFMALYPVPQALVEKEGKSWSVLGILQTNGPYKLEGGSENGLALKRVRGEGPDKVAISWTSAEKAFASFKRGELDWLDEKHIPDRALEELSEGDGFQYFHQWGSWFLRLNHKKGAFEKKAARLAFAHAIDRSPLSALVRMSSASSLVPPGYPGYPVVEAPKQSPAKAVRNLLRGWLDTKEFPRSTLLVPDAFREVGAHLVKQWREILGIDIRLRAMKIPAYLRALSLGEYDIVLDLRVGEFFHPFVFLQESFPELRGATLEELAAAEKSLVSEEVLLIPLWTMGTYRQVSPKVTGAVPNLRGRVLLPHLRKP